MSKNKKKKQQPTPTAPPTRVRWIYAAAIAACLIGGLIVYQTLPVSLVPNSTVNTNSVIATSEDKSKTAAAEPTSKNYERLVGRWLRPDGGYILEIRSATAEGTLAAGYFNPNPIRVARAEWKQQEGKLKVFVELRDVNYPGSTYTLELATNDDRMTGNYFQAAEGANFAVEFVREK